jgi:hypothetical protein
MTGSSHAKVAPWRAFRSNRRSLVPGVLFFCDLATGGFEDHAL